MQHSGHRRGNYAKTDDRRREIIQAAEAVFGEVGFRSASMREIARRVDLSVAGLLHHFPDKRVLLEAVLERREGLGAEFMKFGSDEPMDSVRGAFSLLQYNVKIPVLLENWVMLAGEAATKGHPARAFFADHYARNRDGLTTALTRIAEQGLLKPGIDPLVAATTIIAITDGIELQFLLANDIDAIAPLENYLKLILRPEAFNRALESSAPTGLVEN